jgi:MFS superfamily sulfate permease-like transporter
MRYLPLLLLAPWLLILGWAYWAYPKSLPRSRARRVFDALALLVVAIATVASAMITFDQVALPVEGVLGRPSGAIWQQVLPALYGYAAFTLTLVLALVVRQLIWGRRRDLPQR